MNQTLAPVACCVYQTGSESQVQDEPVALSPHQACEHLEKGGILYFPRSPFTPSAEDVAFLLAQRQLETAYHKNIAYRPLADKLTGIQTHSGTDLARLRRILKQYADDVTAFVTDFLAPYQGYTQLDYASFRPIEEKGRKLRLRARNDLLHVDSFPTRPTQGNRILRVFTNINPAENRVWQTSSTFAELAEQFKDTVKPYRTQARKFLGLSLNRRPTYDAWMLAFHNFLKENPVFQQTCPKSTWAFPPGSAWMVYTDMVSHAVLSGQYALEQTFIVDHHGMVAPQLAPIHILERLYEHSAS